MKVIALTRGDLPARDEEPRGTSEQPLSKGKTTLAEVSRGHSTQRCGRTERQTVGTSEDFESWCIKAEFPKGTPYGKNR